MEGFGYDECDSSVAPRIKFHVPDADLGIMPRAARKLFELVQSLQDRRKSVRVRVSMIQVYNEIVFDLLHPRHFSDASLAEKVFSKTNSKTFLNLKFQQTKFSKMKVSLF